MSNGEKKYTDFDLRVVRADAEIEHAPWGEKVSVARAWAERLGISERQFNRYRIRLCGRRRGPRSDKGLKNAEKQ